MPLAVLIIFPGVVALTVTAMVQEPGAKLSPPLCVNVIADALGLSKVPTQVCGPSATTVIPAGRLSMNPDTAPKVTCGTTLFVSVKSRVAVCPTLTLAGEKLFVNSGVMTVVVAVPLLPNRSSSPFTVLVFNPAESAWTKRETRQVALGAMLPPVSVMVDVPGVAVRVPAHWLLGKEL